METKRNETHNLIKSVDSKTTDSKKGPKELILKLGHLNFCFHQQQQQQKFLKGCLFSFGWI